MLPIRYHLSIMIACEFLGFFVGAVCVGAMWISGQFGDRLWLAGVTLFAGVFLGLAIPRTVFRNLLPARCENCHGRALPQGADPITYVCKQCGTKKATSISEGDGRGRWHG